MSRQKRTKLPLNIIVILACRPDVRDVVCKIDKNRNTNQVDSFRELYARFLDAGLTHDEYYSASWEIYDLIEATKEIQK